MHILLLCLPNINFGCYGNFKLPLVYNGKMPVGDFVLLCNTTASCFICFFFWRVKILGGGGGVKILL